MSRLLLLSTLCLLNSLALAWIGDAGFYLEWPPISDWSTLAATDRQPLGPNDYFPCAGMPWQVEAINNMFDFPLSGGRLQYSMYGVPSDLNLTQGSLFTVDVYLGHLEGDLTANKTEWLYLGNDTFRGLTSATLCGDPLDISRKYANRLPPTQYLSKPNLTNTIATIGLRVFHSYEGQGDANREAQYQCAYVYLTSPENFNPILSRDFCNRDVNPTRNSSSSSGVYSPTPTAGATITGTSTPYPTPTRDPNQDPNSQKSLNSTVLAFVAIPIVIIGLAIIITTIMCVHRCRKRRALAAQTLVVETTAGGNPVGGHGKNVRVSEMAMRGTSGTQKAVRGFEEGKDNGSIRSEPMPPAYSLEG